MSGEKRILSQEFIDDDDEDSQENSEEGEQEEPVKVKKQKIEPKAKSSAVLKDSNGEYIPVRLFLPV